MAKVNLSGHKEGFGKEDQGLSGGADVRSGTYDVVNVLLTRDETAKGAKKLRIVPYILAAVDVDHDSGKTTINEENKDLVGGKFGMDFWCDLSKAMSAKKFAYMIMAHGNDAMLDDFDIDDDDMVVKAITGKPYRITIDVKPRNYTDGDGNQKTTKDIDPVHMALLSKEQKQVYNTPKWKEIVGDPKDRIKVAEKREPRKGGGPTGKAQTQSSGSTDPFSDPSGDAPPASDGFIDDDLPF